MTKDKVRSTKEALKLSLEFAQYCLDEIDLSSTAYRKAQRVVKKVEESLASCQCPECKKVLHASDCAVHNEPAYPKGECNCGAQPEQLISDQINYGMSVTQGGKRIDPMSIYKEPEQSTECGEPVAWMDDYNACKCPDNEARCFSDKVFRMMQKHTDSSVKRQEPVAKVCHDLDGHIGWNPNLKQLPNEGTPLYTTPPQRKPLTDEECVRLAKTVAVNKHQIRAIEAAHGIKGEA